MDLMSDVNYLAILLCAVISMVLGSVWYGPLFGKKWMEICGVSADDVERRKQMQKEAMPLYGVQFVLTLFQAAVLACAILLVGDERAILAGILIWAAFIMPTVAAASMWTSDSGKIKWARFLIQSSYYAVLTAIFVCVLTAWK